MRACCVSGATAWGSSIAASNWRLCQMLDRQFTAQACSLPAMCVPCAAGQDGVAAGAARGWQNNAAQRAGWQAALWRWTAGAGSAPLHFNLCQHSSISTALCRE